jgi:hypothetical protein
MVHLRVNSGDNEHEAAETAYDVRRTHFAIAVQQRLHTMWGSHSQFSPRTPLESNTQYALFTTCCVHLQANLTLDYRSIVVSIVRHLGLPQDVEGVWHMYTITNTKLDQGFRTVSQGELN